MLFVFRPSLICLTFIISIHISCLQNEVKQKPNILFIIADDASKNSFGAYGGKSASTPAIDSLSKHHALMAKANSYAIKSSHEK